MTTIMMPVEKAESTYAQPGRTETSTVDIIIITITVTHIYTHIHTYSQNGSPGMQLP